MTMGRPYQNVSFGRLDQIIRNLSDTQNTINKEKKGNLYNTREWLRIKTIATYGRNEE